MKKRIVCFLLALIMVLGMIPNAAVTANAYSKRNTSAKAIDNLKGSVTFYAKEQSGKIGYSTPASYEGAKNYLNNITKEDAVDLMRDYIEDVVDVAVNNFAKTNNVDLNQGEHDALAVHMYRTGSDNGLFEAVRTIKTVNSAADRAHMVAAFVDSRSHATERKEEMLTTLNISLAEAAMYLYGDYGYNGGSKLGYTRLITKGTTPVDDVVGYVLADGLALPKSGLSAAEFLGWFVYDEVKKEATGSPITKLTKDHNGKIVIAKKATGGNVAAEYTINTKTLSDLNVYNYGSAPEKTGKQLKNNTDFKVTYEFIQNVSGESIKWVFGSGKDTNGKDVKGWIKIGKVASSGTASDKPIASATVTASALTIRKGATADSESIGALSKGDVVNIYETKVEKTETGNQTWGKITFVYNNVEYIGWINLAYAEVNNTLGESGKPEGQTGKIANAVEVNIRSEAKITATNRITALKQGTKVTVLSMNSDRTWAKIKWETPSDGYTQGWVYMHYVQLDSAPAGSGSTESGTVKYTGVVTSNINLNVRSKADVYATKVDSLPKGTKVNIYETKTSKNMKWGRIGTNRWICLSYVDLTEVPQSSTGNGTTTVTDTQATVTSATLDVLKNYNSNAQKVGTLKKGDVVTILEKNTETTGTGSRIWGRISKGGVEGWINLAYVELKTVTTVTGPTDNTGTGATNANGADAVIANCIAVNVRAGAGVAHAQVDRLNSGTAVKVYERVTKDNAPWARITWNNGKDEGWVCMYYVTLGTTGTGTTEGGIVNGTNSNTISATGYVNSNIDLNVRAGAGLGYAQIGSLKKGTKVTVYEQVSADGMIWGRMTYGNGSGWICMSYITVESASSTGKGVMGTIARCFAAVNVRSAPGTNNALIAKINVGSRVEVFETKMHGTTLWGRVAQGWISMDYVLLDSELPPGTILDATEPTTEATKAPSANEETINRDGEIAFIIEGQIKQELNVRNDADVDSHRVGTVKAGVMVDIRAIKNNGAELWGRIDQYGTAGWILMDKDNVSYTFTRYVAVDEQPVYVDANTGSTVKATLGINTWLNIDKVTTDGTNVYGWIESVNGQGIFGWIPLNKTSEKEVDVIKSYKNGETVGTGSITGTTYAALEAVDSIGGTRVLFKAASGVTVKVDDVRIENGKIWGYVEYASAGSDSGEYGYAWIDMSKVTFSVGGTVKEEMNVRNTMETGIDTNIVTTIAAGTSVSLCQFSFDSYGNLWARLNGNFGYDADTNGEFIMVCAYSANGEPGTVYIDTVVSY